MTRHPYSRARGIASLEVPKNEYNLTFKPLILKDLPLIFHWVTLFPVKSYSAHLKLTSKKFKEKILAGVKKEISFCSYMIILNQVSIGLAQCYPVEDDNLLAYFSDIKPNKIAGINLLIVHRKLLKQDIEQEVLKRFIEKIVWKKFTVCVVNSPMEDEARISFYEKIGFQKHSIIELSGSSQKKRIQLMVAKKR